MYYYTPTYAYGNVALATNVISRAQTGCPFFYWPPPYLGPPLYGAPYELPKQTTLADPRIPATSGGGIPANRPGSIPGGGSSSGSIPGGGIPATSGGRPSSTAPNPYGGHPAMMPHQLVWLRAQQASRRLRSGGRRGY